MRRLRAFAALTWMLSAVAGAASAPHYPPAVQKLVDEHGIEIVSQFEAPGGLTGYAARIDGREVILYGVPGGDYVIAGNMFDANGKSLTKGQIEHYLTGPLLKDAWSRLEKATWVAEGSSDPKTIIYEFTDPNCPFCYLFWLANTPYRAHGLQVRHILVGVITPNSTNKAAAILESADPSAAMTANERDYDSSRGENNAGGIAPAKHPRPETLKKIEANNDLMRSLGVEGTPGIFYKSADGKVHRVGGMPTLSELPKMYGLPPEPVTDPRLKRFE